MPNEDQYTRLPKQTRSRESLERILEAATSLLAEVGFEDLTIQEVSRRANVSVGSIYGRFVSRGDLLRAVQVRVLRQIEHEQMELVQESHWKELNLESTIRGFVYEFALLLDRNAVSLRAFMSQASSDPVIAQTGQASYRVFETQVHSLLLHYKNEIKHSNPRFAVELSFRVAYSALARYLGFGTATDAGHDGRWEDMIKAVSDMCVAYLLTDPSQFSHERPIRKRRLKSMSSAASEAAKRSRSPTARKPGAVQTSIRRRPVKRP